MYLLGSKATAANWHTWSALGQKRKWRRFQVMSALPHKADIDARHCDVRFVPLTEVGQLIRLPDRHVRVALVGW